MDFPKTPAELKRELEAVRAEITNYETSVKWARAKLKALQQLCEHKNKVSDNDPRDGTTTCKDCGAYW